MYAIPANMNFLARLWVIYSRSYSDCGSEGRGFEPRRSHGAIAKAYDLPLRKRGHNSELYLRFMRIAKRQCEALPDKHVTGQLL